jgi:uncharacterized membrane protein YhaH (DUF805 family)
MDWYLKVLRNYVTFSGRARRREYWMFVLVSMLIGVALTFVETGGEMPAPDQFTLLPTLYYLAVFLPGLAVAVRRLHDTGRSGWWLLIGIIPFLGSLVLLVFMCLDSEAENKYGPNPKTPADDRTGVIS